MPKVLVLIDSGNGNVAALADAIAEGAESVRFTEVEVRRIDPAPAGVGDGGQDAGAMLAKKYRVLESVESLALHDAVIVVGATRDGAMSAELQHVLEQAGSLGAGRALLDKVGSAFAAVSGADSDYERGVMPLLAPLMRLGMIIVPPAPAEAAPARQHGARVAKVAEWVRHAKSHEAHGHAH